MVSRIFYNSKSCDPSGRPCRLKVKSAGDAIEVKAFPGKVQTGGELAFHRPKVHLFEGYAPTGHKFFLIGGFTSFFYLPLISF